MIPRKYETIVGIFVVASLIALLIMVLIVAKQEGLFVDYVQYRAVFKNVSGLKPGSEVRLAGVQVGTVKDSAVGADGRITVTFEVMEKYRNQIREDSRASIGYIGLLGDRSLDLTAGSPDKPAVPPQGSVIAVEPLDITEMLTRATPYIETIQKILTNLASITDQLVDPKGDLYRFVGELRVASEKINKKQGTLGLLLNDPKLYQETTKALTSAEKFLTSLESTKGLMGTLLYDPEFRAEAQKIMADLREVMAQLRRSTEPIHASIARLPEMAKKLENLLDNLDRASAGLPDLVVTGQEAASDAGKAAQAAQRSWLLRRHVPKAEERTIRVEKEIK
jgi:phospholipid/cholesterol/gamma-HCH transport system substrate-binding protein